MGYSQEIMRRLLIDWLAYTVGLHAFMDGTYMCIQMLLCPESFIAGSLDLKTGWHFK